MSFTARTRYLLVTLAILTACAIQLLRGYKPVVVILAGLTFLIAGNLTVYAAGTKERAARRQQQREYWSR
jgi:hypothetical protein